jgi:putative membrane protein
MPIFNGALFFCLLKIFGGIHRAKSAGSKNFRVLSLIVGGCLMLLGAMFLRSGNHFFYLACTLIWFVPPLMIQWFFDPIVLFRNWRLVLFGTALPTLYFSAVDLFAIRNGIWTISDPTRTGWEFLGLPVEEAFFFFIVSLLLSQGMVLWHGLREK